MHYSATHLNCMAKVKSKICSPLSPFTLCQLDDKKRYKIKLLMYYTGVSYLYSQFSPHRTNHFCSPPVSLSLRPLLSLSHGGWFP